MNNKKKIVLASTMAILLAPAVLNTMPTSQIVQANTQLIGSVRRGGATLVDARGNELNNRILPVYSRWILGPAITINNNTYYQVATNEYVSTNSIDVIDSTGKIINPQDQQITNVNEIKTLANNAHVLDINGNDTGIILTAGTSWKVDQYKLIKGYQYYRVATNEWVKALDFQLDSTNNSASPVDIIGTIAYNIRVVDDNGNPNGKILLANSDWRFDQVKNITNNGVTKKYYRFESNQWIEADAVKIEDDSTTTPTQPKTITLRYTTFVVNSNGTQTRSLPQGSSWKVGQIKSINGHQYYQVGADEWVLTTADQNTSIFAKGPVTATLIQNTQLYDTSTNSMTRILPKGTAWKISESVKNDNGNYFAKVSNNEWIPLGGYVFTDNILTEELADSAVYEPNFATNTY